MPSAATKVTLTQANLAGGVTAADVDHRDEYEKNWSSVLEGLAKIFPWREPLRTDGLQPMRLPAE